MTDDDPRPEFRAWLEHDGLAPDEAEAGRGLLAEIGDAPQDVPDSPSDWSYLRRWPVEVRLGVRRVLDDLGVLEAMKSARPADHAALLAELERLEKS